MSTQVIKNLTKHLTTPCEQPNSTLYSYIFAVRVIDVFAMPQSGTGVSVEAVDPVFQVNFIFLLNDLSRVQLPILLHRPKCWTC